MKKSLLLMVAMAFAGMLNGHACIRKAQKAMPSSLTILVMDTTQALLNGAQVTAGKTVYTTSFDGRVVLKPEQLNGVNRLQVACEGYKSLKVQEFKEFKEFKGFKVNDSTLIVRLVPTGEKTHNGRILSPRRTTDDVFYSLSAEPRAAMSEKMAVTMAVADAAAPEEMAEEMESMVVGYAANNIEAGKLTAGEVNDFAKWYFWPKILDETHAQFVKTWRIEPRHRYTVQVMNKDGYPIASRAVSLLDNSGNTLFQAVTDNTGKAELWYQLIGNHLCGKHADFYLLVDGQKQKAKDVYEGLNTFVLDEPCEHGDEVDVMFVFDATGSMGDELRYLQAEMKDVIARASDATGGLNIRTGAVVYRDHSDEYITRLSRLTDDIKTTQAFIDKQEANGGGDYEEAVPEALMAAMNSAGWNESARARIAFLILDAPCHTDSASLSLLHEQVLNAAALGVRIVPVVCSGLGESGEYLLRSIALATNGTSFFLTDDSGIGHTHLKPTTDSLKVEHLNDMLVRTIVEFSAMVACTPSSGIHADRVDEQFIPNPFSQSDLEADPTIPHGEGIHYLVDVSGKLISIYEGDIDGYLRYTLPHGVYFVKTYIQGKWYTKKILL